MQSWDLLEIAPKQITNDTHGFCEGLNRQNRVITVSRYISQMLGANHPWYFSGLSGQLNLSTSEHLAYLIQSRLIKSQLASQQQRIPDLLFSTIIKRPIFIYGDGISSLPFHFTAPVTSSSITALQNEHTITSRQPISIASQCSYLSARVTALLYTRPWYLTCFSTELLV